MRLNNGILNTAVVVSVACTLLMTGLVVRRELFIRPGAVRKPVQISAHDWSSISTSGLRYGPTDATLTVVEFIDFECPACAAFSRTLKRFRDAHRDEVAVVLQHLPLSIHPNAVRLAQTVECAAQKGRLEAIQDSIFSRQSDVKGLEPLQLARIAGVADTVDFANCIADSTRTRSVAAGQALAQRLNIGSTPTLIMNARQYRQLVDSTVLGKALQEARRR